MSISSYLQRVLLLLALGLFFSCSYAMDIVDEPLPVFLGGFNGGGYFTSDSSLHFPYGGLCWNDGSPASSSFVGDYQSDAHLVPNSFLLDRGVHGIPPFNNFTSDGVLMIRTTSASDLGIRLDSGSNPRTSRFFDILFDLDPYGDDAIVPDTPDDCILGAYLAGDGHTLCLVARGYEGERRTFNLPLATHPSASLFRLTVEYIDNIYKTAERRPGLLLYEGGHTKPLWDGSAGFYDPRLRDDLVDYAMDPQTYCGSIFFPISDNGHFSSVSFSGTARISQFYCGSVDPLSAEICWAPGSVTSGEFVSTVPPGSTTAFTDDQLKNGRISIAKVPTTLDFEQDWYAAFPAFRLDRVTCSSNYMDIGDIDYTRGFSSGFRSTLIPDIANVIAEGSGITSRFSRISDASWALPAGGRITVVRDIPDASSDVGNSRDRLITLDLAGHTLSSPHLDIFRNPTLSCSASVELTDSVGGGSVSGDIPVGLDLNYGISCKITGGTYLGLIGLSIPYLDLRWDYSFSVCGGSFSPDNTHIPGYASFPQGKTLIADAKTGMLVVGDGTTEPSARVGDVPYTLFADALEAARGTNATVTLARNAYDLPFEVGNTVLDLNGHDVYGCIYAYGNLVITNSFAGSHPHVKGMEWNSVYIEAYDGATCSIYDGIYDGEVNNSAGSDSLYIYGGRFKASRNEELAGHAIFPAGQTLVPDGDTGYLILGPVVQQGDLQ